MTSTKLAMNAAEIFTFARLAGITLTPRGVKFPKMCARATVVYSATGLLEDDGSRYVPVYQNKFEDQTGFTQDELLALEHGFEDSPHLAKRDGVIDTEAYRVGRELRSMINRREPRNV